MPRFLKIASVFYGIATAGGHAQLPEQAPTREAADKLVDARLAAPITADANDLLSFTPEELKALDVESSKIIDIETFVPRAEVDPVYFGTPYYVYPDGRIADQSFG